MSFKFAYFCDYLEKLEELICKDPPLLLPERKAKLFHVHATWFASHRKSIDTLDIQGTSALLSAFLPRRRKDRIYGLQSTSLCKLLGRCLALSATARTKLGLFRNPGNGDLGEGLQRLLQTGGPPAHPPVTLQEVDDALHGLAGANRFSAPSVQQSFRTSGVDENSLRDILLRLYPVEAKWFVRLILKDFSPVSLDDQLILKSIHFLLPDLMGMQDNLESTCIALKTTFDAYPSQPDPQSMILLRKTASSSMRPVPGVKVSRPEYCKARSIKQCLAITAGKKWLVERKYDGEYCQIHIDLTRGGDWLKIYSKSGRDSTEDRTGLREIVRDCLRIGSTKCKIKKNCIVVGEMVVFSDSENRILGFDEIRKHVSRAGVHIGAEKIVDQPAEHLMIIFFDLLLLDDEPVLSRPIEERKAMLSNIYKKLHGRAAPAESRVLDFAQANAGHRLINHFAASVASCHEGLVLKPCGVSYFRQPFGQIEGHQQNTVAGIKLKKDYISGLGDEADFAVLGASYDAQEAKKRPNLRLRFTHFHLGCLTNQSVANREGIRPSFRIVATIAYDQCMSTEILERVNFEGGLLQQCKKTDVLEFDVEEHEQFRVDFYFRKPLVFEVLGSSYSNMPGGYLMLRHPRVKKLHRDRAWNDCITFDELQKMATEALKAPPDAETQENLNWIAKLENSHKKKHARLSLNTTPRSSVDGTTPHSTRSHIAVTPQTLDTKKVRTFGVLASGTGRTLPDVRSSGIKDDLSLTSPYSSPCHARETNERTDVLGKRSLDDGEEACSKRFRDQGTRTLSNNKEVIVANRRTQGTRTILPQPEKRHASDTDSSEECQTKRVEGCCKFQQVTASVKKQACIFSRAVVFISGLCLKESDRIRRKVLEHGAIVIEDLDHWRRDSRGYQQLADTVGESQAYMGLRKMVLIDPRRVAEYRECYSQIARLELQKVEILDYRVVDVMCDADIDNAN